MLTALVLICSLAVTPDLETCSFENALGVMRVPQEFASPVTCLMQGQAYLAQSEIGQDLATNERLKIVCSKTKKVG
jgi:hypothetical protein